MCEPSSKVNDSQMFGLSLQFAGPTWYQSRDGTVLLASRRYNGSRSRKTKGSLADTFQCNIWRRAQTPRPHRMTHCLHGGDNHSKHNGFTALGKTIGTSKSTETDADYVAEHHVKTTFFYPDDHFFSNQSKLVGPAPSASFLFRFGSGGVLFVPAAFMCMRCVPQ